MHRYLLLVFLFSFTLYSLHAEEEVHVIEIRYEVYVENEGDLSSYKYKLPYETFHIVSPNKILTLNKYAADIDEVHMYDLEESLDYRFYYLEEEQDIAVKSPLQQIPTLITNGNNEQVYQIGGMLCKRYEIAYKNSTVEIYTTDSFGVNFTPFSQVSGYAMQYSFIDEVYGRVTYVAKSILPTVVNASAFSVSNYRVTDEVFPADIRNSFDELIVAQESSSLFKLNKKNISYNFKLRDRTKVTQDSDRDNLVVFVMAGVHRYSGLDKELVSGLIKSLEDKNVKFYFFGQRSSHSSKEFDELESFGFNVAYFRDVFLSKFKVEYFPTYILLDKERKVIKYKIGTNSEMLSSFASKIIELSDD